MYLLGKAGGHAYQEALWQLVERGKVIIRDATLPEIGRMRELMRDYHDTPMDLADASLVAAAEVLSILRIFTVDKHFYAYRTKDGKALEVVS
jgi:predicted nucleic acid-binding protein